VALIQLALPIVRLPKSPAQYFAKSDSERANEARHQITFPRPRSSDLESLETDRAIEYLIVVTWLETAMATFAARSVASNPDIRLQPWVEK